jgi:hypothetical protein
MHGIGPAAVLVALVGVSFKALRLGRWRFQRCPVGEHWSLVTPVKADGLPEEEKWLARQRRDVPIP